jgi:predicted amidohydrolase
MTIVKAAAVQISPVLYSRASTVEKVIKKIGAARSNARVLSHR